MLLNLARIARYPFTIEAQTYLKKIGFSAQKLQDPIYRPVLNKAIERIRMCLNDDVQPHTDVQDKIEFLSFFAAEALVREINEDYLKRRFSLFEATRAYYTMIYQLPDRQREDILDIATGTFNWDIKAISVEISNRLYNFAVKFTHYLKIAPKFHDEKWKLVNRFLKDGYVYLTTEETARLLQEEIQRKIESDIDSFEEDINLVDLVKEQVDDIISKLAKYDVKLSKSEIKRIDLSKLPPCIMKIYNALLKGQKLSHIERFTFTSFMLNLGMSADSLINLFSQIADFNPDKTRYQVEHIAGMRGSKIKYSPPSCSTLKTHGVCINVECGVKHPLSYYRRKLKSENGKQVS